MKSHFSSQTCRFLLALIMHKEQIVKAAAKIKTKEDLLDLLNLIKNHNFIESDKRHSYPISLQQLNYYCNPKHTTKRFYQFQIPKKSGGTRIITTPATNSYKLLLSCVNDLLKSLYSPSPYAMGFSAGKSVVTNASVHTRQNYVFNIDLKDFFPSIEQARVWKRLQMPPFNFSQSIASIIAGLCAMQEEKDGTLKYILPQGAPTSPILTNMICDNLDRRLAGLAKRFGLRYTRYADDITFSSMHNVYQEHGDFRKELTRIIADQGFTINDAKTRLQKQGSRQEVTGLIVSQKVNVPQKYTRNLRNILYIWDRYGLEVARNKFLSKYKTDKIQIKGNPDFMRILNGKLMYLKMVKGEQDSVYQRLHDKFFHLMQISKKDHMPASKDIVHPSTISNEATHINLDILATELDDLLI